MDYTNRSVGALFRGPVLHTPQGRVVVASAVAYGLMALAVGVFDVTPPLGKSTSSAVAVCLFWPFVVFLMFVKQGLPEFKPSRREALFLVVAAAPVGYAAWYSLS